MYTIHVEYVCPVCGEVLLWTMDRYEGRDRTVVFCPRCGWMHITPTYSAAP
jgi:predicted RNA-binding Zn-ribbon protein involved in translation (DUF1610 family)